MDQSFRILVMAAVTYRCFYALSESLWETSIARSFLINIIGILTVFGSFIIIRGNEILKLSALVYYILIIC